jgi:hypothetical protein
VAAFSLAIVSVMVVTSRAADGCAGNNTRS